MNINQFDPPGTIDDLEGNAALAQAWSAELSGFFDGAVALLDAFFAENAGGTPQFYNPVTNGIVATDTLLPITWNGFPKRFKKHITTDYAGAEQKDPAVGQFREQDEYLEWFAVRDAHGKIKSVQFTCEGPDYWDFLARHNPAKAVELYRKYIDPGVDKADLFLASGGYNIVNKWNTASGAMHLSHPSNFLQAEVRLASDATVRRHDANGVEPPDSKSLIDCAKFGDPSRNSDPKIGFDVNGLARQGFMITLANPVGLYIASFKDDGLTLPDGTAASGCFNILRGKLPLGLRAEFRLPGAAEAKGLTVSDVSIGGKPIEFGGQLAELITMSLTGAACKAGSVNNPLQPCGAIGAEAIAHAVAVSTPSLGGKPELRSRRTGAKK
jgi:hypothetical protein